MRRSRSTEKTSEAGKTPIKKTPVQPKVESPKKITKVLSGSERGACEILE